MSKFDQYGLKEVANVTFYDIESGKPVLFLDTLKVSNIETSAEETSAQGGWGNPKLITWDYGKEVNVTLEDALFSPASLEVMMGANLIEPTATEKVKIQINEKLKATAANQITITDTNKKSAYVENGFYALVDGKYVKATSVAEGVATFTDAGIEADKEYRVFYTIETEDSTKANLIEITADKFGGSYKIVGDTLVRNKETLKDEAFQFVIGKAKVNSDVSFEMSADGDPATFSMPITVMKDEDGNMFQLIKYNF